MDNGRTDGQTDIQLHRYQHGHVGPYTNKYELCIADKLST